MKQKKNSQNKSDGLCNYNSKYVVLLLVLLTLISACQQNKEKHNLHYNDTSKLFTLLPPAQTGIDFENNLQYDEDFNIYTYRNFYNGGGVALGDINRDGLMDIYLTGNQQKNRLYLSKGNFIFEDQTDKAGVGGKRAWSTGVTMTDINGDGWLDIYVCNSGDIKGDNKQNELFINNQDGTFTEQAANYGLADKGYSTHAAFFDYDKDGDLDLYLLNNSYQAIGSFNLRKNMRPKRDPVGGDKLYRNNGDDTFTDISEEAGIYGSVIGFGLGVTVGDVNADGWQDIYISNDFFERDYLYINEQDGTFKEVLTEQMNCISAASMGADMADINNDLLPDIFVTDMLPKTDERLKTKTSFENWDRYQYNLQNGYYHQFTRNTLQINNGNGTFSETGRMAGVHASDWSWGALMVDLDNDGWKDLFIANGIYQDLTDQDYINFIANEETIQDMTKGKKVNFKKLIDAIPSEKIPNYVFKNPGMTGQRFIESGKEWGLNEAGFSNGAAYGDLDNDGDLDLVINNVNMPAFVYRNNTSEQLPQHAYLSIQLIGKGKNTQAIGSKVRVYQNGQVQTLELMPARGFQSSVDSRLHFGFETDKRLDSLIIDWPDGSKTFEANQSPNLHLIFAQEDAKYQSTPVFTQFDTIKQLFYNVTKDIILNFKHKENDFIDFDRDRLLMQALSSDGPCICEGDINKDGKDDFYIGGAKEQSGVLYIQTNTGRFKAYQTDLFGKDKISEDTDCAFFDADGDSYPDLYVASGGNEFSKSSSALADRLYINKRGHFQKSESSFILPAGKFESTACVRPNDFDKDGDVDLLVAIRLQPFLYGVPMNVYLLENKGKGDFKNVTKNLAPDFLNCGLVKDALWTDVDRDGDEDVIVIGEWMPIKVFENQKGHFKMREIPHSSGWWNKVATADIDGDGDMDFVLANHGLNSVFQASEQEPVTLAVNDFDKNGTIEHIISRYQDGRSLPIALRQDLVMQMPYLKKKYLKFHDYRNQSLEDIFTKEELQNTLYLKAEQLQSGLLLNKGNFEFEWKPLPKEMQYTSIQALLVNDFDNDGYTDILAAGNFYRCKPETGRYDAGYGLFLKGKGNGDFYSVPARKSGFSVKGEVRDMELLNIGNKNIIAIARNDEGVLFWDY